MRNRLMFQLPVEIAFAIARVSFERSCHESRMSGYLAALDAMVIPAFKAFEYKAC